MSIEEDIKKGLEDKFSYLKEGVTAPRKGRVFVTVALDRFLEVLDYAVKVLGFDALSAITGSDETDAFTVIYHFNLEGRVILSLKVRLNRDNPVIKTLTSRFPNADIYERELVDLLGIKVEGLPEGLRYPLPDGWPKGEYPLRKDWINNLGKGDISHA